MFKYLFPLILTSFLGANSLSVKSFSSLNKPFIVKSNQSLFNINGSYTHKPLLDCSPRLEAVYKKISTKELKVIPKISLYSSTSYHCSYKKEKFIFKTTPFKILESHYFKDEKILRLNFNDKIKRNSIREGIQLQKIDKLSKTNLQYKIIESSETVLLLKINEKIAKNTIQLTINRKLKTANSKSLSKLFLKRFNLHKRNFQPNSKKKSMTIIDDPQMVALDSGEFALRIFLDDTLEGKPENFIEIEGIENFTINRNNYANYSMRKRFGVSNSSYYYTDIKSSEFKPNRGYKVFLKKGLESYRQLKEDKAYTLKTKDRAKTILFSDKKPYISNHGELGFSSVNVEKATLIVERLLDDNIRYFMNFNSANEEYTDGYTEEIFTKELILNNQKNKILKQKFKLSELSKKELPFGVYKITLRYSEKIDKELIEKFTYKRIFLSDLGISVNLSKEQAFISLLSLSKAQKIEGAKVSIYGENNALLGQSTTNSDGIVIINKKEMLKKGKPKGVLVETTTDKNFLALNETIDSPSREELLQKIERFKAHIYFQSKIVRPASKINALITLKDRDFISASKLPVKIKFLDPHGKELLKKVYHTGSYGLIDFSYQLDDADKRGNYTLLATIGDNEIGRAKIKVEAFLPPKIENSIKTDKTIYQKRELIELNISSRYLFGTPASLLNGKVTLNARPVTYSNKAYKNYTFSNSEIDKKNKQHYIDYSENIKLDKNGKYSMVLSPYFTQKIPSILEAMVGVTIMDDAQPISNYKKVKIYPYRAMVGLKLNRNSFEKGEKLEGRAILIDPLTGKKIERELYVVVKKITWQYNYSNGNYNWNKEVNTIESFTIKSNSAFSKKISNNGDFIIEVHDHLGGHSASSSFDIWWWSYTNISPKNDLKSVEIEFEDKLYKKGENISIQITSPILEGQLLLTLEGEKVQSYKIVELHKGVAKVIMPIKNDMGRGLQLHATAFRASDTHSNLIPYRAMGYKFVKPDRRVHQIKIETNLPEVSKSNRVLKLNIKTNKPSKVLVSIVDRGILQLVEQKKPKIFDYFNEVPQKAIAYYDLYDQLMSYLTEGKLIGFGAGDMLSKKRKHLAPDLGKRVKPFMIWSGVIDLSSQEKSINITVPEFNGRASVVVVAINQESIGVSEQDIKIRDDVMLKPSYPLFALAGDVIEVPLRIFNTTNIAKEINISTELSDNLAFVVEKTTLTIPANSSIVVKSTLYANRVGEGRIKLYAQYDSEKISKSVELPIYSPYAISTKTFKGISNKTLNFTAPREYRGAKVILSLSDNLIGALRDDLKYLVQYPYGCAEQTSSKLSAMYYAKAFLKDDNLIGESKNFIRQGIKKLYTMQNYYGEFNYWQGGSYVHPYASLYASQIILELQKDGTEMATDLVKKSIKMLKSVVDKNGRYSASYSNVHRLYAGFILAEHNELTQSSANMLYEKGIYKGHFLATFYMSAIRKMQGKVKSAEALFAKNSYALSRYAYKTYGNRTGNFESNVRDLMLHFLIKTKYFNKSAKDLVVIQKEFTNLYSTQTKAVALKAISSYLGEPKSSKLDVNIEINGENENYSKSTVIIIDKLESKDIKLSTNAGAMSYSVELIKHLPRGIKNSLSSKKELSIEREFINGNEEEVDLNNLIQGDKLYSKVTILNYGAIKNVVVNQRIPACLTIVNSNIKNNEAKFKNKNIHQEYREIGDDRVLNFINLHKKEKYQKSVKKYINIENRGIIYTPLMATSVGECKLPAVIIEAMYDSRINDYAKGTEKVIVQPLGSKRTTPQPKKITKENFEKRAKELVEKLYQTEMNSNNELEFTQFFNFPLSLYFRTKNASKDDILKDKKTYFKDWSKRHYSNIKIEVLNSSKSKAQIKILFNYTINSGKKILEGESKHFLMAEYINGKILITAVGLKRF
jgi:uncharacterized protein YfaS (alpha-2-macroglobulin family)